MMLSQPISCKVPSDRILAIYAGVQVSSTQALVDTAAEDAVIGEKANRPIPFSCSTPMFSSRTLGGRMW